MRRAKRAGSKNLFSRLKGDSVSISAVDIAASVTSANIAERYQANGRKAPAPTVQKEAAKVRFVPRCVSSCEPQRTAALPRLPSNGDVLHISATGNICQHY